MEAKTHNIAASATRKATTKNLCRYFNQNHLFYYFTEKFRFITFIKMLILFWLFWIGVLNCGKINRNEEKKLASTIVHSLQMSNIPNKRWFCLTNTSTIERVLGYSKFQASAKYSHGTLKDTQTISNSCTEQSAWSERHSKQRTILYNYCYLFIQRIKQTKKRVQSHNEWQFNGLHWSKAKF